jgi:pimeloyl-ACP methyl ester carboxylesterase
MAFIERPSAKLNYETWGPTPPRVTLINGHTRPLNDFRLLGRHLAEQGVGVLALDNRGAGATEVNGPFTLADLAGDVVALWDHLEMPVTDLLGISMGGFIAQTLALGRPDRVRRLILVSTAGSANGLRRDDTPWSQDPAAVERKLAPYFTAAFAERNAVLVKSMAKQIAKAVAEGDYVKRSDMQRDALAGFDVRGRLAAGIKAKTLIIHGTEDRIIPVAAAEELQALIPGARLEALAGAGHLLLAERPKELYALVHAFLSSAT